MLVEQEILRHDLGTPLNLTSHTQSAVLPEFTPTEVRKYVFQSIYKVLPAPSGDLHVLNQNQD